jgi:hypothetical protein
MQLASHAVTDSRLCAVALRDLLADKALVSAASVLVDSGQLMFNNVSFSSLPEDSLPPELHGRSTTSMKVRCMRKRVGCVN